MQQQGQQLQQQQPVWQQQQQQQQQQSIPIPISAPPPPPAIPMLPPGWVTATDPVSGRMYYANATTGQTSWEPPPPAVILPPPPPPPVAASYNIIEPTPTVVETKSQPEDTEFLKLSAGGLADFVHIQQEQLQDNFESYQNPIQPHILSVFGQVPHIEPGRVEIRLNSLYRQLQNIR